MKTLFKYSIFAIFLFLSACTSSKDEPKLSLEGYMWNLSELGGKEYFPSDKFDPAYIEFAPDKTINGTGGCNEIFGTYETSGRNIKITSHLTARHCEGAMDIEFAMDNALRAADEYKISGEELFLYKDGKIIAKFFAFVLNN
jgi:heat shock protein HslJ